MAADARDPPAHAETAAGPCRPVRAGRRSEVVLVRLLPRAGHDLVERDAGEQPRRAREGSSRPATATRPGSSRTATARRSDGWACRPARSTSGSSTRPCSHASTRGRCGRSCASWSVAPLGGRASPRRCWRRPSITPATTAPRCSRRTPSTPAAAASRRRTSTTARSRCSSAPASASSSGAGSTVPRRSARSCVAAYVRGNVA